MVDFEVTAQNRDVGWSVDPRLALVGMDGVAQVVEWGGPLENLGAFGTISAETLVLPYVPGARIVKAQVRGFSAAVLPVPATEALIDVLLRNLKPATEGLS